MKDTKKIKKILIIVLTITLVTSSFITYKTYQTKQHLIEENKKNIKNNQSNKKQFAIFLKNPDNNQYETYNGSDFPEGYIANLDKSNCADINGNIIKGVISNSDNGITVTSNKTVYCEIYLEKKPPTAEDIANTPVDGVLESTGAAQDELATRYYGTNPPNYICFGTTNKSTCTGNQDKYMYRIIGITKNTNMMKVIKKTPIVQNSNKMFYWHDSNNDITWPNSDLYKGLNGLSGGKYSNLFIGNTTYVPNNTWSNKIATVQWRYADVTDGNKTAAQMIGIEQATSLPTTSAKIGLMYLSDYYYAYQKAGLNCSGSGQYSTCKQSWMYIMNNDSTVTANNQYEWTMSRCGAINSLYFTWSVLSDGSVNHHNMTFPYSARPVFYIVPTAEISGTGTIDDPYLIVN